MSFKYLDDDIGNVYIVCEFGVKKYCVNLEEVAKDEEKLYECEIQRRLGIEKVSHAAITDDDELSILHTLKNYARGAVLAIRTIRGNMSIIPRFILAEETFSVTSRYGKHKVDK